jgi:predicted nucleic acid-binding protein
VILVDTSVWIGHLRQSDVGLVALLDRRAVLGHAYVLGEIACGNLRRRANVLALLADLPQAVAAADSEVLGVIERHRLMGRGIGYIDAHLIASTLLTPGSTLWTRDVRLAEAARALGVSAPLGN